MHWMNEYYKDVDMSAVRFAKSILRKEGIKPNIDKAIEEENDYIIRNVMVTGFTVKDVKKGIEYKDKGAVFFGTEGLIKVMLSYYPPLRFSMPKSQLLEYETEEYETLQTIKITNWGYKNAYMQPVNKILEDWGKMMRAHFLYYKTKNWDEMFKSSTYKGIVDNMNKKDIRDAIDEIKKRNKGSLTKSGNDDKQVVQQGNDKTNVREKAEPTVSDTNETPRKVSNNKEKAKIFFVDGSGNVTKGKQFKENGHYSVYLVGKPPEKWKKKESYLTGNQAEIKANISAIYISLKRGYDNIEIRTDSQNVIKWYLGRNIDLNTNMKKFAINVWKTKNKEITILIDKLVELGSKIPNLKLTWIERSRNHAHAI